MSQCPFDADSDHRGTRVDGDVVTPYEEYIHAAVLTNLQQPLSDDSGEMAFVVTTQVMELWFTLIVYEWRTARDAFSKDDYDAAMDALRRSLATHRALNDSWRPIATMTPMQFNGFRESFGTATGFQSAMYRHLEFLLGDKSKALINQHSGHSQVYAELAAALHEPSLYDEVLGFLDRRGYDIPDEILIRDLTVPYVANDDVEKVWQQIYSGSQSDPLVLLGEVLTDIAEAAFRWRHDHVYATRRAMGSKTGSGGSTGVAYLEKRATRPVFPEVWTARGAV